MIPSNSISLNSPAGDLLRAFSKDAELIGFLQSSDYCYCLIVGSIPFYVFHQMNDTFVTRILYGTPFRSEAERQSAFAFCRNVTAAVSSLYRARQRAASARPPQDAR